MQLIFERATEKEHTESVTRFGSVKWEQTQLRDVTFLSGGMIMGEKRNIIFEHTSK